MTKRRLAPVLLLLACAWGALTYFAWFYDWPVKSATSAVGSGVSESDWGHLRAYDGQLQFLLGPAQDQRSRYEVGFGRVVFSGVQVVVADDANGRNARPVPGRVEGRGCLFHAQGAGVNVVVAIEKCVPWWASVTADPKHRHAKHWIRVSNLRPTPVVVVLAYR